MSEPVKLRLGVKTDPIEYRYSHPWLFELLAEEEVRFVQLGTHFELYQLPDDFFHQLRAQADAAGVVIDSAFTAHRELGGFFREESGYELVARQNFERYIEVASILGVKSVGSNPGAVLRDRMEFKPHGVACYMNHMKELMHFAHEHRIGWLTIEPMSCLAEPPTLPLEIEAMAEELTAYHNEFPNETARIGFCTDIAHGYADHEGRVIFDHEQLFEATVPWLYEVHLKNTDAMYNSTFGFAAEERQKGIIDVPRFRQLILAASDRLPVTEMAGYLEIGGPKLGRDYSDHQLESSLRQSLRYLKQAFLDESAVSTAPTAVPVSPAAMPVTPTPRRDQRDSETPNVHGERPRHPDVLISPSMMCVDALNFEANLREVEALGVDMLHMDIMDARFVPNMPMGLGMLEPLRSKTDLPIDVHLMVQDNDFFIELLREMGVHQISVHVESCIHLDRTLTRIREIGAKAGAAVNPGTSLETLRYVLERLDYVLVMTVNPGYAGQSMTPASIRKIADCRRMLDDCGFQAMPIQVDGNVSFENIPEMVAAGGSNLVAGTSSLFHRADSRAANLTRMRDAIARGLAARS